MASLVLVAQVLCKISSCFFKFVSIFKLCEGLSYFVVELYYEFKC